MLGAVQKTAPTLFVKQHTNFIDEPAPTSSYTTTHGPQRNMATYLHWLLRQPSVSRRPA
jgi:hypothetical protein